MTIAEQMLGVARDAKKASRQMANLSSAAKNDMLQRMADAHEARLRARNSRAFLPRGRFRQSVAMPTRQSWVYQGAARLGLRRPRVPFGPADSVRVSCLRRTLRP
jgi:hypothetical protein